MIPKALDQIRLPDLQQLIDSEIREGRDIEYKLDFPSGQNRDKVHMLKAVTSMANSGGGDVVYGMRAVDGLPVEAYGLVLVGSEDEAQLRLENTIRDSVQPRLQGIGFKWVSVAEGRIALVIRVKSSWNAPHRVIVDNHNHFYGRNSVGAYPLDVAELRAAFLLSDSVGKRMTDFRTERLLRIEAGKVPVRLTQAAVAVMHVLPVSAFGASHGQRLMATKSLARKFSVIGDGACCFDVNLDGAVAFEERNEPNTSYTQVFRDGCLEVVVCCDPWQAGTVPMINGPWLVDVTVNALAKSLARLATLSIDAPYVVSVAFIGVDGHSLRRGRAQAGQRTVYLNQSTMVLPDAFVDDPQIEAAHVLRPIFDILWNAFGFECCEEFDDAGNLLSA
jgi:hypothetical protein